MKAFRSAGSGMGGEGGGAGREGKRGRRQDKRTGTLRAGFLGGEGEFPGPGVCSRALLVQSASKFKGLIGTFGLGGGHAG